MTDGLNWLRVPGATRSTRDAVPVPPPDQVGGFRFARTADGTDPDGAPRLLAGQESVTDPAERDRLLAYLGGGASVVDTVMRGPDLIDPTRQLAVPVRFRTDGTWVWPASVEYYLRWHRVAPEPDLYRWIVGHRYSCRTVPADVVARARAATDERATIVAALADELVAAQPQPRPGGRTRFPPDVVVALLSLGWHSGRDVGDQVQDWLAPQVGALSAMPFERDGFPRFDPFPAALAVMREFGGLASLAAGPGQTAARMPFSIYPDDGADLASFAVDVRLLGDRLGRPVFQVGDVERRMGALAVDEAGRVFIAGSVQLYAGTGIDEALTRMLRGVRCEELWEVER